MKKAVELLKSFTKERQEILDRVNASNNMSTGVIQMHGRRLKELEDKILVLEYALSE